MTGKDVALGIKTAFKHFIHRPIRVEVGFFGGTFTLLPLDRQAELLGAVRPFLDDGNVHGLRLSTRPDALAPDQVLFLKEHGVTAVEIGAQSMDDEVLRVSRRGHTAEQTLHAAAEVKKAGLRLGLQLLPGLPGETDQSRRHTLERALVTKPDDVRIYPLLVVRGTQLAEMYEAGMYLPLRLPEAVAITAEMFTAFTRIGAKIIRMGLQDGMELNQNVLTGPYHPAFGELVKSHIFLNGLICALETVMENNPAGPITIYVPSSQLSQALGMKRENLIRLLERFNLPDLKIRPDKGLEPWRIVIDDNVYSMIDGPDLLIVVAQVVSKMNSTKLPKAE